jgi:hypothetical protein
MPNFRAISKGDRESTESVVSERWVKVQMKAGVRQRWGRCLEGAIMWTFLTRGHQIQEFQMSVPAIA